MAMGPIDVRLVSSRGDSEDEDHLCSDLPPQMRYLTLAADYREPSLVDERDGPMRVDDLGVPGLGDAIVAWNERYQLVMPAGIEERRANPMASLINQLDRAGCSLAERVAAALGDGAKVKYYSEGLLRHLP